MPDSATSHPDPSSARVAVVGAGYWGRNLVRNFAALGALAAVCDTRPDVLRSISAEYPGVACHTDVDALLNDGGIDAVAIATPAVTHGELTLRMLTAGKDVLVEKPLALTVPEGEAAVALAEQRGRVLMVGHLLWYHPAVVALADLVQSGELGEIRYIYSNRLNLGKIRAEENILWSFAPHDISVILGLVGELPISVHAGGGTYLRSGVADVTVTLLDFPGGVKAHIFVSWLHPFKEQRLVVVGERQMAVFDDTVADGKLRLYPHAAGWDGGVPIVRRAESHVVPVADGEPLANECAHFLDCVATRRPPRTDGHDGLAVLEVLEACSRSLTTEAPVAVLRRSSATPGGDPP